MNISLMLSVALVVATTGCLVKAESKLLSPHKLLLTEWEHFKLVHGKVYESNAEEDRRFKIYLNNRLSIAKHNLEHAKGMHSYTQAINRFSDMEYTEIIAKRTGLRVPSDVKSRSTPRSELAALEAISDGDVPASVDWRTKGAVTEVKNQGDCGACWAFAATGALEAAHFLKSGKLVSLSEQNLMDCSWPYGNRGCDGGLMENAYKYVIYHGLDTEQSYPFIGHNGECMFNKSSIGTTETSFIDLQHEDELALKKAVALHGPVSVGFAVTRGLSKYEKGVFHDEECEATEMNHAVLIVGYGTDPNEGDYWIVKNSWDTWWGEDGYFRVARNKKNMCHIASWAVYPIV